MAEESELEAESIKENVSAHDLPNATSDPMKHIPPTKRYAPKPRNLYMPWVLPWENSPTLIDQRGMKMGLGRDAVTPVDQGEKPLVQGNVHTETILTKFAETNIHSSQQGMTSFGAHRVQTTEIQMREPCDSPASNGIIPRQAGTNQFCTQAGESPFGLIRLQVPRIKLKEGMDISMSIDSRNELSRYCEPNPHNHAGSSIIGMNRPVSMAEHIIDHHGKEHSAHHRESEAIVPMLWDTRYVEPCEGTGAGVTGLGAFRPTVLPDITGMDRTREEELVSEGTLTYQTSASAMDNQEGTGGFNKKRDPVNYKDPLRPHLPRPLK